MTEHTIANTVPRFINCTNESEEDDCFDSGKQAGLQQEIPRENQKNRGPYQFCNNSLNT